MNHFRSLVIGFLASLLVVCGASQSRGAGTAQDPCGPNSGPPANHPPDFRTCKQIFDSLSQSPIVTRQAFGGPPQETFGSSVLTFALNSAEIRPSAFAQLDELGRVLQYSGFDGKQFVVVGYTDKSGSHEHNIVLSRRRADAVIGYLKKHFQIRAALRADGRADGELLDPAHPFDEVNRRVVVERTTE